MNIYFEKAEPKHQEIILSWLQESHMIEFWDNSQEHKDDILNFIYGRKQHYFYGTTQYWVGYVDNEPYCFVLSDIFQPDQDISDVHRQFLSKSGHTIGIDFGIGNTKHLGKGLAALTLKLFVEFYHQDVDKLADTFFIDPDEKNIKAQHVYDKAGFKKVGEFYGTAGAFIDHKTHLMVRKL